MRLRELLQARCALAILSLGVGAGCGDDHDLGGSLVALEGGGGAPSELPGGIGLCSQGAELELIDDMEDDQATIIIDGNSARHGVWFSFNNNPQDGDQEPKPGTFYMDQLDPPRGSSRYAARTRGSGFVDWGGGIGFELRSQLPYDASGYAGFAFWARRDADASARLRADVTDRNTSSFGGRCDDAAKCSRDQACDPALMACFDNFGVALELGEEWQFYSYRWDELSQAGWSGNLYSEITRTEIFGIRFQSEPDTEFEFWIDDVAFVCPTR
jgi:hypothetical protein